MFIKKIFNNNRVERDPFSFQTNQINSLIQIFPSQLSSPLITELSLLSMIFFCRYQQQQLTLREKVFWLKVNLHIFWWNFDRDFFMACMHDEKGGKAWKVVSSFTTTKLPFVYVSTKNILHVMKLLEKLIQNMKISFSSLSVYYYGVCLKVL